jgi:hypothetical protein
MFIGDGCAVTYTGREIRDSLNSSFTCRRMARICTDHRQRLAARGRRSGSPPKRTFGTEQTGGAADAIIAASVVYRDSHMIIETCAHHLRADVFHMPVSGRSTPRAVRIPEAFETRSNRNIRSWQEFLAEDCVTAMIRMGWDRTT